LTREQRLVFGEVAEAYHALRPTYPGALLDALVAESPGPVALEVGAGTGKATAELVARGLDVLALEPSPEMAAVLRRAVPGVRAEESGFEDFTSAGRFDVIYAAQAWHWVDQDRGYAHARELLRPGGLLALFWNRAQDTKSPLMQEMDEVYRRLQPALFERGSAPEPDYVQRIRDAGGFTDVSLREFPWTERRTAAEWVALLGTFSDHRLLPESERAELLREVAAVIDRHGGVMELPHVAKLYLARSV
jgi:SAM-dependent methyltransferase